ncbi:hypothetical protein [Pedobacter sp. NJ-S-72]
MDYNSSGTSGLSTGIGVFGGFTYFAIIVLIVYSLWRIFEKAGKPDGLQSFPFITSLSYWRS